MGSLMPGWASHNLDQRQDVQHARRNRSLTKDEIEAFWKQGSPLGSPVTSPVGSPLKNETTAAASKSPFGSLEKRRATSPPPRAPQSSPLSRTNSEPLPRIVLRREPASSSPVARIEGFPENADEKEKQPGDWWLRSNWAFLNEPPLEETPGTVQTYNPQFNVARIATGNA